ncbi:CLUMA_CG008907, isoform A [Clunio marinus]|uniref:CLUMA_CG008907, isoform A n=1 Tax=Clunio marinus TaxID=568069 RepID=A0A1J1I9Q2_9DIPT|nr:CLUMA_CG008907, isoform A [Clunio marinus]
MPNGSPHSVGVPNSSPHCIDVANGSRQGIPNYSPQSGSLSDASQQGFGIQNEPSQYDYNPIYDLSSNDIALVTSFFANSEASIDFDPTMDTQGAHQGAH